MDVNEPKFKYVRFVYPKSTKQSNQHFSFHDTKFASKNLFLSHRIVSTPALQLNWTEIVTSGTWTQPRFHSDHGVKTFSALSLAFFGGQIVKITVFPLIRIMMSQSHPKSIIKNRPSPFKGHIPDFYFLLKKTSLKPFLFILNLQIIGSSCETCPSGKKSCDFDWIRKVGGLSLDLASIQNQV